MHVWTIGLIAALAATTSLSPLCAQTAPAEPDPGEIEVRGKREIDREVVVDNLRELTTRISFTDVTPRFYQPLCLHVIGPDVGANRVMAKRITEAAKSAGLKKPKPGCRENALVIIVDEPSRLFERLVGRRHWMVGEIGRDASLRRLREELKSGKPAIAWNRTTLASGGVNAISLPGSVPVLQKSHGSRIPGDVIRPKVVSVVVFDSDTVGAATPVQLGDYAALQLLGTPQRNINFEAVSARSILSLFADGPDMAPDGMTAFDRAYLKGLYANRGPSLRGRVTQAVLTAYEAECVDEQPDCQFLVPPEQP